MQSFGFGQARTRNVIGTGLTTTLRQYAAAARTSKASPFTGRYLRFMLAQAPAQNENLAARIYTYNTGGFVNAASNWTQQGVATKTITAAEPLGIVEFDLGVAVTIGSDTLFSIGLSSVMAVAGAPSEWFMESLNASTLNLVGGGWIYVPGNTADYTGGVIGINASASTNVLWWEFAP